MLTNDISKALPASPSPIIHSFTALPGSPWLDTTSSRKEWRRWLLYVHHFDSSGQ